MKRPCCSRTHSFLFVSVRTAVHVEVGDAAQTAPDESCAPGLHRPCTSTNPHPPLHPLDDGANGCWWMYAKCQHTAPLSCNQCAAQTELLSAA